jgi:hypothetical protein
MTTVLTVRIVDESDDAAALERGAIQLRHELGELDVVDVSPLPGGPAPDGSRSASIAALGALAVSIQPSAKLLLSLVQTVRGWLTRGGAGGNRTVRIEVGGDVLELTGTSSKVQDRLVDEWIRTHAATDAQP